MNQNLEQLYQQVILDHNKNPRNFKKLDHPTVIQEGFNPLCGDHLHLYLKVENDKIVDISFEGKGCAISKASASMMTAELKGKDVALALEIFEEFHQLLLHQLDPETRPNRLGKLKIFSGIWKFPARVKCASLSWHTLKLALEGDQQVAKTE